MLKKLVLLSLMTFIVQTSYTQIQWSANVGTGVTYFENVFDGYPWPHYTGGLHFQGGTSISSLFNEEGMVGWEAGLNISTSAYYFVPDIGPGSSADLEWDYANRTLFRDWYIQMPLSFTFNMFEGTGFIMGARINRRLTNLDVYADSFRKWIPAAHLGIFTQISPRIRLDATAFMDIPKRLEIGLRNAKGLRELGGSVNIRYTIR